MSTDKVMNFDGDAFISYALLDNVALKEGGKGWIANLHQTLEARVAQLLGKQATIWRDTKQGGSEMFENATADRLRRVAALVSVVSPAYVKSQTAQRELIEFCKAAEAQGGVRFGDKARVFKVLKTPVPLEKQALELQLLLGYEFFKLDPESGKVRELDPIFGSESQKDFLFRLDDLAHDICCVLEMLEGPQKSLPLPSASDYSAVFLAETTSDLSEQRDSIRRDLLQHGYTVLPGRTMPLVASAARAALREDLARSRMSIHLIGKRYGLIPEGAAESLLEMQNELAIERGTKGNFCRLVWIPAGLKTEDERQRKFIEHVRTDPRVQDGADVLENRLEDLRTVILDRLKRAEEPPRSAPGNVARIYLMYDRRDADAISPCADFLFELGMEVIRPLSDGDEAEIREFHEENLRTCDGALIFYGAGNECWLRRKLRELEKSAGYGREHSMPDIAIVLTPPKNAEKERFRTHEAVIIPQWDGLSTEQLRSFVTRAARHHAESRIPRLDSQETVVLDRAFHAGTTLGRYEIIKPLGAGGMGEVFLAHDPRLDRDVALKILRKGLLADEAARRQFHKEARALAKLNHQHIANIYDDGQETGVDYLVMEFVPGETLAEKLKFGPLPENTVVSLGAQIAEALEEAHERGVVHRDLKPANIMVTARGQVKVLDFGLAKVLITAVDSPETQSAAGAIAGTLPYMAPEQLRGEPADGRTDVYALGNVIFEMAVGRRTFQAGSLMDEVDAIRRQPPLLLRFYNPKLSAELEVIVARTLEKDRDLRYQSAADLRSDLTRLKRAGI